MSEVCKLCGEKMPIKTLQFSNTIAVALGYCCFMCMVSDLGEKKALAVLNKEARKEKQE